MCPDSMEFERDHLKSVTGTEESWYMQDYASYVKDDMIQNCVTSAGI